MAASAPARLRTAPELATLLLELNRLIRARLFYAAGDARLAAVFERSLRAWQADLGRRGSLELDLLPEGFSEVSGRGLLSHPRLARLQQDLAERGVQRLRFEASLDSDVFAAFAEVLATDAGRTASRGGFAAALYSHCPAGIVVNGIPPSETPPSKNEPAPSAAAGHDFLGVDAELSSMDDLREVPPSQDLDVLLRQLDEAESTSSYLDLARRTVHLAERAWDGGRREEAFRVFVLLSKHAHSKSTDQARELAESFLRSLVQGERLDDVIRRAGSAAEPVDLEASQILLSIGEATVPALLDAASSAEHGIERDRLAALVVSFGDRALPILLERLTTHDAPPRLRAAIRAAAELQHPGLLPPLGALLEAGERSVREEAVRALARVGSDAAVSVLSGGLRSDTPGLALAVLHALGSTGSARAVEPLRRVLDQAVDARDLPRAKEVIRALGRLGRAEAGRPLVSLLERRGRIGGGWLRELKAAAATALGNVPGDEAVAALAQAAQARDTQLRRAAQTSLDRRAQTRTRAGR